MFLFVNFLLNELARILQKILNTTNDKEIHV